MSDTTTLSNENTPDVEQDVDALPKWVREAITNANDQAAKYRVKAREAADKARDEVTSEFTVKLAALTEERDTATRGLARSTLAMTRVEAALAAGIPAGSALEFAGLLQGENAEEIHAHADKVRSLFSLAGSAPDRPVDPSQGLGREDAALSPGDAFGAFIANQLKR